MVTLATEVHCNDILEKAYTIVGDLFGTQLSGEQFNKLLTLCPEWNDANEDCIEVLTNKLCKHFVGRGFPWKKESPEEEYNFWQQIKEKEIDFKAFVEA